MKKIIIVYIVIVAAVFVGLSVLGLKGDYVVEKKLWRLYKKQKDIAKDPSVIPDVTFDEMAADYGKIITKYPDSYLTPGVRLRLGELYAVRKDYDASRRVFDEAVSAYPENKEYGAVATFEKGRTYELGGNWPKAEGVYRNILSEYPDTERALEVPIYIASHHKSNNDFRMAMDAYAQAIAYYKRVAEANKGKKSGLTALRFLSNCYLDQHRWQEAVETLGKAVEEYSGSGLLMSKQVDMMLKTINIVCAYQLDDYGMAIRLYEGIIARNPKSAVNVHLQQMIDAFKRLEEEGVRFQDKKTDQKTGQTE